jgi:DNA-binding CsgD family transcriptional regulator
VTTTGASPFARWHALIDAGDPRFTMPSTFDDMEDFLPRLESDTHVSLWNMQRQWSVYELRDEQGLNDRARRKGVTMRLLLPRRVAESRCPLASSHYDPAALRLAPVAHPMLISDGRRVLVGDSTGETVWTSTDPGVVASAVGFYERAWAAAEPARPEGAEPRFTRRMVDIGVLLVDGATDREIARTLGVSDRTVSSDVREMSARLGARSRTHAIALISGVYG